MENAECPYDAWMDRLIADDTLQDRATAYLDGNRKVLSLEESHALILLLRADRDPTVPRPAWMADDYDPEADPEGADGVAAQTPTLDSRKAVAPASPSAPLMQTASTPPSQQGRGSRDASQATESAEPRAIEWPPLRARLQGIHALPTQTPKADLRRDGPVEPPEQCQVLAQSAEGLDGRAFILKEFPLNHLWAMVGAFLALAVVATWQRFLDWLWPHISTTPGKLVQRINCKVRGSAVDPHLLKKSQGQLAALAMFASLSVLLMCANRLGRGPP